MSILNVNKINPIGGGSTVTIAGIASVTNSVTAPTFVGDINNSTLLLQTGSSERLRITADGDVGINVTPTNNDMAGVKPRLHVSGISTDGQFNTVARFQAGGDADSTGAMIVINHGNDRGLAIQGGRISGNYAHGALKMIDFSGRLSDAMVIHGGAGQGINDISFFTGASTTTTNRLIINSAGLIGVGTATGSSSSTRLVVYEESGNAQTIEIKAKNTGGAGSQPGLRFTAPNNDNIGAVYGDVNSDSLIFATGTVERLKISPDGHVIKPTNLCLSYTASGSTNFSSGTIIYNTLVFDVNSSGAYNTSTGVFTAPVTGVYLIYHEYYAPTNSKAMTEIQKSTNGGGSFSPIKYTPRVSGDDTDYDANGCSFITQLNANDQIKIIRREGTVHINNTYTHFQVQLIQ